MTQKLKELLERAEKWPEELQEELIESGVSIEKGFGGGYELTDEDTAALARSEEDVRHGRLVSEEEIRRILSTFKHA